MINQHSGPLRTLPLVLVVCLLLTGCEQQGQTKKAAAPELPPVQVELAPVTRMVASNQIELVGTLQAVDQAMIASKITGNISSLPVDLGTRIARGDLLVEISADEISAQLQQAQAQLNQARRNLAREEKLLRKNAATKETVKSLQDGVRIAQASYEEARTMLNYTRITAPFDGIVTGKVASTGDMATPGKPLLNIERENKLQIATDIPEAMIHRLKKGDQLQAYIPAVKVRLVGEITEISPIADPTSRTTPIKLRIVSEPHLRSGQFARITLALEQTETLSIPATAVVPYGQMERVFVADRGRASLRLVRTGSREYPAGEVGSIEILSGLSGDEEVIVSNNHNLENGQPLIIQ